jgi:hypothetical protein
MWVRCRSLERKATWQVLQVKGCAEAAVDAMFGGVSCGNLVVSWCIGKTDVSRVGWAIRKSVAMTGVDSLVAFRW